ncbi:penicillin-binding protein [Nocardioides sp. TF02-7]|nr:penicillin-binding protein [Nocardioides sp. TF02-7]
MLVEDRPVLRYGLDKTKVRPARAASSAERIAEALDIEASTYVERVRAAGPEAFVEALVLRVEDAREDVDPGYAQIPGAVAIEDQLPLAPTREFAAELLGRVGPATAEMIEESGGEIEAGDVVGTSGLQARYDDRLGGTPGLEVVAVGADDRRRRLFRAAPDHGRDLVTTIDPALQMRAEEVLATLGEDGPRSALVAIRPSDGEVLAVANGPGNGGLNVATAGQYAPGSTFKVVTALALLRAGVEPDDVVSCNDTVTVDGRPFENYDDYPAGEVGDITFTAAIAHSCNTALIAARDRLGSDDLRAAAAALGLGVDHDLGFPAYFGQVPTASGETEHAASLIGQGKVLASPMTMAAVAASIAAGRTVVPTLLTGHRVDPPHPDAPLTESESRTLRELMRAVVTDGSGAFLADVPGEVGAKTGTAEYGEPGPDRALATHAWMIATREDLAVAVFVETGDSGSGTAGPLLEEFLR